MMMTNYIVVIPVYNESKNIAEVLKKTLGFCKNIVVVDNASQDNTLEIVRKFPVAVVAHPVNVGKAGSIKDGLQYAVEHSFDGAILIDGDGEHDPSQIPEFIRALEEHDLVVGERRTFRSTNRGMVNKWSTIWFNLILSGITDAQCGYRGLRKELINKINLSSKGFEIEIEILLEAVKSGARIKTIPIETNPLRKSHLKFKDYLKINNFFDKWVLKNLGEVRVSSAKKIILFIGAIIGIGVGSIGLVVSRGK